MNDNWQVHIAGPDDVLPATSRLDAMRRAQEINQATIDLLEQNNDHPYYPTTWAAPVPPGGQP